MDSLLRKFNEARTLDPESIERSIVNEIVSTENPFYLPWNERDYSNQFYSIYQHRLNVLKERVEKECNKRWDDHFRLNGRPVMRKNKVLDIEGNEPCWCIGTIYCEMKYKPNILEEVINDTYNAPDLAKSYTDPEGSDEIMLEDESGRVLLVGDFIRQTPFITGAVVGLLGMEADAGTFQVLDICYPSPLIQRPLPSKDNLEMMKGQKIALVSGLNLTTTTPDRVMRLQLLQEFLIGNLYNTSKVSQIGKLIICGNLVEFDLNDDRETAQGKLSENLDEFGNFLANTLQSISIDILPGRNDPSDRTLPQQPLHKALFNGSIKKYIENVDYNILSLVTNPYQFDFNGWQMLATSGQSINDICKYIMPYKKQDTEDDEASDISSHDSLENRLDLMECTLKWQNIAPTAPDTLWCYPYKNNDPFILKEWPHLYVIGNQPEFGSRETKMSNGAKIKIISVPEFSETGKIVLLDMSTLEVELVSIEL
ncbi:hypothetical protein KAFR_0J00610 [Kazachstania africana CBS 2517]|uniref:DNA-directed DNA polymerase n=1 Tax=Kazachstania africana (strain ATCC 22294 / BCRC 22015 / CBS 2517 / CECT 1963 / NBRC 1671 / NRRL Y-8276) TaxID=1071382 RepID=H2B0H9_KAZAF|nr:hypothetical protein KAFR_0J00610 [Kazachstania africana CBS 2517]CCF60129.1 hypothetical protein KAFR_0J00610 [Kazachstania africana CBS 2517]